MEEGLPRKVSSFPNAVPDSNHCLNLQLQKGASANILSCNARPDSRFNHCIRSGAKILLRIGESTPLKGADTGTIVARCGGNSFAVAHCTWPIYEPPHIATLPLQYDCRASHSTTS